MVKSQHKIDCLNPVYHKLNLWPLIRKLIYLFLNKCRIMISHWNKCSCWYLLYKIIAGINHLIINSSCIIDYCILFQAFYHVTEALVFLINIRTIIYFSTLIIPSVFLKFCVLKTKGKCWLGNWSVWKTTAEKLWGAMLCPKNPHKSRSYSL